MASAEAAPAAAPPPARSGIGVGALIAVVLLSIGGAGGVAWLVTGRDSAHEAAATETGKSGEDEAKALPAPAVYLALEPAFTVNLESPDDPRYLQTEVELMSRDPLSLEAAKVHLPRIRNALLLLFGQQKPDELATREGKERLQQAALAEVQNVLTAETGKPAVEAVYFTSFVMQ